MWFVRHARLWLALLAEVLLLAALHRFDDWRYASMPVKFVETAVLSGIAFFAAASFFGQLQAGRRVTIVFWSVALLRNGLKRVEVSWMTYNGPRVARPKESPYRLRQTSASRDSTMTQPRAWSGEAGAGIEPANRGFADPDLTTWLPRRF